MYIIRPQTANLLHNRFFDERPLIIFISATDKHVFDGYGIAWKYICKPINKVKIQEIIERAYDELELQRISIKTTDGIYVIKIKEIIYIESYYGDVKIHTLQKTYSTKMTLEKVVEMLSPLVFFQSHRCYYVNLGHLVHYDNKNISLSNSDKVPISRYRKKALIISLADFSRSNRYDRI